MASKDAAPIAGATGPTDFPLTLEEYCARLSGKDKRVELIGGFFKTEQAAGRTKDTEAAFDAAFSAFVNQPA